VHLGIAYDVAEGSFPFHHTEKPFFFETKAKALPFSLIKKKVPS
jgi:hypothetical protein